VGASNRNVRAGSTAGWNAVMEYCTELTDGAQRLAREDAPPRAGLRSANAVQEDASAVL